MKSLTEIYTPLIRNLQDLNLEIRRKLSSMPSYTEQEMQNLAKWLEEIKEMAKDLENNSLIVTHHLNLLEIEYKEQQQRTSSKD